MTDLLMDINTNDLVITNGDLSLNSATTNPTSIQQRLQQSLQLWLGEWFLDTTVGIPYRQQILVKNPNIDVVQADIVMAAAAVPGVEQILDFSLQYSATNRSVSVSIVAQDSSGQTITAQASIGTDTVGTIEGTPYP